MAYQLKRMERCKKNLKFVRTSHQNYMKLKELLPRQMIWKTNLFAIILLFLISFTKYNPFFSTKLLSCSFSLMTSRVTVSFIFSYTADIDFVLFLTGKLPTLCKKRCFLLLFFVCSGRLFPNFLPIKISVGDNPYSLGVVRWINNPNDGSLHFLNIF